MAFSRRSKIKVGVTRPAPDPAAVLTKATLRAADKLNVSRATLAQVLGLSESALSGSYRGDQKIHPRTKQGELSALLVRLYRCLHLLAGGDGTVVKRWMESRNDGLGGQVPGEYIKTVTGLLNTLSYLESLHRRSRGPRETNG